MHFLIFVLFASSPSNSDSESDIIFDNGNGSISQVSVHIIAIVCVTSVYNFTNYIQCNLHSLGGAKQGSGG